jgi:hypothetical protein
VTAILAALACAAGLFAQELEPRRWGHLPTGANFAGLGYIRTEGDIALDPVLRLADAEVGMDTVALKIHPLIRVVGEISPFRPGAGLSGRLPIGEYPSIRHP